MTRNEVLEEAKEKVCNNSHGEAENSFERIAKLWSDYTGYVFNPVDVAMMMALLKVSSIKDNKDNEDSFIDLIGYAACACELDANEKSKSLVLDVCNHVDQMVREAAIEDVKKSLYTY